MKPQGSITLDAGAARAMALGKSLLPAGVTHVSGTFHRGDPVTMRGPDAHALGIGLTRYTAAEARAIAGHRSSDIEAILGYPGRAALMRAVSRHAQAKGHPKP